MMYTLDASGQTGNGNQPTDLWPAGSAGTRLFIQNQSQRPLSIIIHVPAGSGQPDKRLILGAYTDFADESDIDPTLGVSVSCDSQGATFAAWRMT